MDKFMGLSVLAIGLLIGHIVTEHDYKAAAIERGYAQYSETTGEWFWKEEVCLSQK